jgi:hypothetical protein
VSERAFPEIVSAHVAEVVAAEAEYTERLLEAALRDHDEHHARQCFRFRVGDTIYHRHVDDGRSVTDWGRCVYCGRIV